MKPRKPLVLASLFYPGLQAAHAEFTLPPESYDYSYQLYREDSDRIEVESHYFRGQMELDDRTTLRFQWLRDAISGSSPTGAPPGSTQPVYADIDDVRIGVLGALARQFDNQRFELEISHSKEEDYLSKGLALTDTIDLNDKNTTITTGFNLLSDTIAVPLLGDRKKHSYDFFGGVSQIIDKNTLVSANLTLGYSHGYLNDQYKVIQRTDQVSVPDGVGGTIDIPVETLYRENRPDSRFRQVLQLEGRRYFDPVNAALDAVLRFSHDDYGVNSQTVQLEWRQSVGEHFLVTPFFRFYHQNAADFFHNTLDGLPIGTPAADPNGSGVNYSADYRLSSFNAISGGLKLNYHFTDNLSATASYERYVMEGTGSRADQAPEQAYIGANIWTFGLHAEF